ncbi:MAG: DnaB-like helicase C-terminal domain-containing protein, partial [Desulfovibrio sp.]|nr:DnaB-like helicase C-terminal domain-containing protein [Desulfovibrio sp.]
MIDDTPSLSPYDLHARCSRIKRSHGLNLVIVDYLQIMGSPGRLATRDLEVGELCKMLKALSKELSVPVLALSQLNRNATLREDQRPQLSDLRESGAIAHAADIVIFVHRRDDRDDSAPIVPMEIIIGKNRNDQQGTV